MILSSPLFSAPAASDRHLLRNDSFLQYSEQFLLIIFGTIPSHSVRNDSFLSYSEQLLLIIFGIIPSHRKGGRPGAGGGTWMLWSALRQMYNVYRVNVPCTVHFVHYVHVLYICTVHYVHVWCTLCVLYTIRIVFVVPCVEPSLSQHCPPHTSQTKQSKHCPPITYCLLSSHLSHLVSWRRNI